MKTKTIERQTDVDARDSRSDGQLLAQFIASRNQEAFSRLMQRHGPYLFGVCRRATNHHQDAEDVFQACFLELVRHAASIARGDSVAGWLQTVAVRLARKACARRACQRKREASGLMKDSLVTGAAVTGGPVTADEVSWREVRQILDEEIARLPHELRSAIILCLFEGRTQEEAAQFLEVNPRTLKDRVRRGRELLQHRLTRRGVTLAVMGALLSAGSADSALTAALQLVTLQGATAVANKTALAGIVSPAVLGLTGSSLLSVGWGVIAAVITGLVLSAGSAYVAWEHWRSPVPVVTVRRSFRNGQFDSEFFRWSPSAARKYARLEPEGLRLTLPATDGPGVPIGIALRHPVRGDFELEATLEFLHVTRPDVRGWAGATVYFFMDDNERNGVWFGKMNERQRGPVFATGHRANLPPTAGQTAGHEQERIDKFIDTVATSGETGVLRLRAVRRGTSFSFFAAEGETGEYRNLQTLEVSAEDLEIVRLGPDPGWLSNVAVDMRLVDFSMTAREFVGYQSRTP
jgi:RNA polymerase sigma factor (sigma-70 family)